METANTDKLNNFFTQLGRGSNQMKALCRTLLRLKILY